eukprot:TRINITY_DN728_c0_g5_i1.p1 TRINITY_DN728_c0_g5~~TRINITY_DN728_c0_g5_i1.p1  ORF type:complete len:115 (+),score=13.31 TRINITY_DN728_c0_g5_i1:599-943(+)
MFANRMSISFGKVLALNPTQVALSTSALGGSSGAPCFCSGQDGFMAVYLGIMKSNEGQYRSDLDNHALRVHHPHFINSYMNLVACEVIHLIIPEQLKQILISNVEECASHSKKG